MEERIKAEHEKDPNTHTWEVQASVPVDTKTARRAELRGSFRAEGGMVVKSLEVICSSCRRPFDMVADEKCSATIDNTHLIGGDSGVRAKRIVHAPVGKVIQQPLPSRRGLSGYSPQAGR